MRRYQPMVLLLALALLTAPIARADDDDKDKKTAEEMERVAEEAMKEAQEMLDRAKAKREAAGEAEARKGEGSEAAAAAAPVAPPPPVVPVPPVVPPPPVIPPPPVVAAPPTVPPPPETPRERKIRMKMELREQKHRIRMERMQAKQHIRAERIAQREKIRADRIAAKEEYWNTHRHPKFYLNFMILGGGLTEDKDNRLTGRDSTTLEGLGGMFRVGAVLKDHHMVGGRFQFMARPTDSVLGGERDDMGLVASTFVGPEWRYVTGIGFYLGLSVGMSTLAAEADLDDPTRNRRCGEACGTCEASSSRCRSKDDAFDEHRSVGIAGMGVLGWEIRLGHYFALYAEAFAGYSHGLDEDERTTNNAMFGIAVGLGI